MRDDRRTNEPTTPGVVRVYGWRWGPDSEQRPGVPWLGLFLVVFGALLLLERLLPGFEFLGAAFFLAIGLAFLVRWATDRRRVGSLYAGAIIAALGAPGTLSGLGIIAGPGLGQFSLGVAFLLIAAVRYATAGGVGWQAWLGVVLVVFGGSQLVEPRVGQFILPALIVAFGAVLVLRGWRP